MRSKPPEGGECSSDITVFLPFYFSKNEGERQYQSILQGAPGCSLPVQGSAGLHGHPVDGKVHLPDKGRHADGHRVGGAQHHAGLLPHDPAGGSAEHSNNLQKTFFFAASKTKNEVSKTPKTSSHSHSRAPNFSQGTFLSYRRFEEDRVAHEMLMSSTSSSNEPLCFSLMSLIIWKNLKKSRNLQKTTHVAVCSVTNCCFLTSETR